MAKPLAAPYLSQNDVRGDIQIWTVDGSYIRGHMDEEFTNFGQHYRYPYIPLKEFWLDAEAEHDEHVFFIDHLLVEYGLMSKGMPYEQAIVEADRAERKERRAPATSPGPRNTASNCRMGSACTNVCGNNWRTPSACGS